MIYDVRVATQESELLAYIWAAALRERDISDAITAVDLDQEMGVLSYTIDTSNFYTLDAPIRAAFAQWGSSFTVTMELIPKDRL